MPRHAIVMGGSVAGLCAAAALSDAAERVTLIERDPEPEGVSARRGTPQGWHAHLLLNLGARSLEELMPGLMADLGASGAVGADAGKDFRWYLSGDWRPVFVKGLEVRMQTRSLLEATIREHVRRKPGVSLRFGARVDEPLCEEGVVRGVRLKGGEELEADLVVDATGKGSRTPQWLERWGFRRPPRQSVKVELNYTSGLFRAREDAIDPGINAVLIAPRPPDLKRGAAAFRVENDRWMVTLFGYHGARAPDELDGFRSYAATVASDEVRRLLANAELDGEFHRFKFTRQIRNRYEKLRRSPAHYLVMGDAVCSFDPVFGQGMSVAAAEAVILRDKLRKRGDRLRTRAFQAAIAKVIDDPWQLATTEAYNWPETTGWRPPAVKFLQRFTARLHDRAADDPELYSMFLDVIHMDSRPSSLFSPKVLRRVLNPSTKPDPDHT